jgi:hypothetical protein
VNIQGTFREHSGNIQGTSVSTATVAAVLREHSGNIQGTFREHSANMQGTCTEHSWNIQGTFSEHAGDMQGTCREHAGITSLNARGLWACFRRSCERRRHHILALSSGGLSGEDLGSCGRSSDSVRGRRKGKYLFMSTVDQKKDRAWEYTPPLTNRRTEHGNRLYS